MNAIVMKDKVEQFNLDIQAFLERTNNYVLRQALDVTPRSTSEVVGALRQFTTTTFQAEEVAKLVEIIEDGDGDISKVNQSILDRLQDVVEAHRLLDIYAEIMGARVITAPRSLIWIDWSVAEVEDHITG